jgi:hypothetical protein
MCWPWFERPSPHPLAVDDSILVRDRKAIYDIFWGAKVYPNRLLDLPLDLQRVLIHIRRLANLGCTLFICLFPMSDDTILQLTQWGYRIRPAQSQQPVHPPQPSPRSPPLWDQEPFPPVYPPQQGVPAPDQSHSLRLASLPNSGLRISWANSMCICHLPKEELAGEWEAFHADTALYLTMLSLRCLFRTLPDVQETIRLDDDWKKCCRKTIKG